MAGSYPLWKYYLSGRPFLRQCHRGNEGENAGTEEVSPHACRTLQRCYVRGRQPKLRSISHVDRTKCTDNDLEVVSNRGVTLPFLAPRETGCLVATVMTRKEQRNIPASGYQPLPYRQQSEPMCLVRDYGEIFLELLPSTKAT
ncbi:hypothetical protein PG990_003271 [Apiospora arundinis]